MLEAGLVTLISAICPNVYPLVAPTNYATPAVVYQRLQTTPLDDLSGFTGCSWVHLQIKVYDPSYLAARNLMGEIRNAILAWDGVADASWIDGVDIIDDTTETFLYCSANRFLLFVTPNGQ